MNNDSSPRPLNRLAAFRNWLSFAGLILMGGAFFSFCLLFLLDLFAHSSNPYVGLLTYMVAPAFGFFGLCLVMAGFFWERRKMRKAVAASGDAGAAFGVIIDLSRPKDRRVLMYFLAGAAVFLLVSAMGSYHTYHFTESVTFCGQACHTVMEPEMVTYLHGPHARVTCTECHIGPGAQWWVKSKLSGTYQVYAVATKKYPTPIPTPVANLRPAQETCERCHWPKKFIGNLDRTYNYYLADETNTAHSIRMLMKVGGSDPTHGPVGGIHWHMSVGHKVEYIATDPARQKIPWVRMVDAQGVVTEFRSTGFTNDPSQYQIRTVDCMDCHNRPAHRYTSPNDAINLAISLGQIDARLPWIKTNAVYALTMSYTNKELALQQIATFLAGKYPNEPKIRPAIEVVQQIYTNNFFPAMKASWKAYPDNIGHMDWPGCFRCHDDKHKTSDGKKVIKGSDCSACHIILSQGSGKDLEKLDAGGQKFKHPGDELSPGDMCNDCHNGGP